MVETTADIFLVYIYNYTEPQSPHFTCTYLSASSICISPCMSLYTLGMSLYTLAGHLYYALVLARLRILPYATSYVSNHSPFYCNLRWSTVLKYSRDNNRYAPRVYIYWRTLKHIYIHRYMPNIYNIFSPVPAVILCFSTSQVAYPTIRNLLC